MARTPRFVSYMSEHDESWLFFFLYMILSIFLSLFFNLGFFVILIVIHLMLDFLKHWHSGNRKTNSARQALVYTLRDGFLLDFLLLLIGFAFGYVLETTFAVGISRGVKLASSINFRSVLRAVPRIFVANWVVENVASLTVWLNEHDKVKTFMPPRVTKFEKFILGAIVFVVVIIVALPVISGEGYPHLLDYAWSELIPRAVHEG